jgi:hypothetical protein
MLKQLYKPISNLSVNAFIVFIDRIYQRTTFKTFRSTSKIIDYITIRSCFSLFYVGMFIR